MSCLRNSIVHALVLTLPATSLFSIDILAGEAGQLPEITVTATKIDADALAGTTVDPDVLIARRAATSDTATLIDTVPGVSFQGAGGVSSLPVIHGLADDRLRIKVDGMDLISACGNHMNPALSYLDPSAVDNIRVFAGITPVSAGGDSIGGAIQVDSFVPVFAEPGQGTLTQSEVGVHYRSNNAARGGNVSTTLATGNVSINYQGSTVEANNYHAGDDFKPAGPAADGRGRLDGDEVGSTMYKSTNQSLGLGLRHGIHLFDLKLGVQDIPYQGWPNQRMDMTGNDSTQVNLHYQGDYAWGMLDARVYRENTRHKMQFADDKLYWYGSNDGVTYPEGEPCVPAGGQNGCAAGMPMDTRGRNRGVVIKAEIPLTARDLLRVGAEAQRYRLDDWWEPSGRGMWPDTFWNIRDGERDRLAVFGEWEASWNPRWLTLFGLRGERVHMDTGEVQGYSPTFSPADETAFNLADRSRTDNNLDANAVVRFTPSDTQTYEFGFARQTRSPNLYERYAWSTHGMAMRMINWAGDGNGYVGNLDLQPETAHTLSFTADWHDADRSSWGLAVTPYITYVDDYIDAARCYSTTVYGNACTAANLTAEDAYVYLRFDNRDARLYGVDVSGFMPLAKTARFGEFKFTGMLSHVRGKTDDDDLYNIMPLNAKLAVEQRLHGWTNSVEVRLVDAGTNVSRIRNEVGTAGYGLLNLRSSYEWKQARLDAGIENVLDRAYSHPLGGAYLGQGKTMSGTDVAWGTTVPGMGRSVYAGVTVKF